MPDPLTLASRRPAEPIRAAVRAVELEGQSLAITRVQELLRRAAAAEGGVLIVAEHGVDVASVARELHDRSRQPDAPFIGIDCTRERARLDLLLFGTPSTGVVDLEAITSDSRVAAARGGTLFLEDVGELPASVQARLARLVRDGEASIDGQPVAVSFRLTGSATPGIDGDADARRFRMDLYRRLCGSRIDLPPLRDRPEDVPALAIRTLEDLSDADQRGPSQFHAGRAGAPVGVDLARQSRRVPARHRTSGRRRAERGDPDRASAAGASTRPRADRRSCPTGNLKEARLRFERDYIAAVLQHHGWKMADAAQTLGIQRPNLYRKARQLGITLTRATD